MWARIKQFWLQKHGNMESEYEDAFFLPKTPPSNKCATLRLAVADGATETSYSGLWAKLLVRSFGRYGQPVNSLDFALTRIRAIWKKCVNQRPLPWFAEAKVQMGAFSSLLGLSISNDNSEGASTGKWTAHAVGDSCLFHIQEDKCLAAFPLQNSDAFSSRPALLSSSPNAHSNNCPSFTTCGTWKEGDVFFLMTDALACWFLASMEQEINAVKILLPLKRIEDFTQFIAQQRIASFRDGIPVPILRNDDITMIVCEMVSDESPRSVP